MVSSTRQTARRRRIKQASVGRAQKRERTKAGTPKFPIHLDETAPTSPTAPEKK